MLKKKLSSKVWQDPVYFIAFGFGTGLLPFAPGTWGTLVGIPLYFLLAPLPTPLYLLLVFALFLLGIWCADVVTADLGEQDYAGIVWDEVVGYLLTMTWAPYGLVWVVLGFLLFRFFDILKPPPISLVDRRIQGGLGVMLDDVLAAIPAALVLQLIVWMVHR